uniref:Tyrosine-protein phosphatase domain-containing protein n=1 Tax=Parastrongyloides trichosuri TaxID=131310 RepID=A0A0N4ZZR2_PARTI
MRIYIVIVITKLLLLSSWLMAQNATNPFPSAPKNVLPSGHIEYNLTHNSTSDVVMVKCPEKGYNHSKDLKGFTVEKILDNSVGFARQPNKLFFWSAFKISDASQNSLAITCGYFLKKTNLETPNKIYWKINVKWMVPTNVFEIAHAVDANGINANPMSDENKCDENNIKLSIVTFDKAKKNLTYIKAGNIGLNIMYAKQIFYFFKESKLNNVKELLFPCGIAIIYYEIPNFVVDGNTNRIKSSKNEEIFVVRSVSSESRKYNIKLLELGYLNAPEFYADEEISSQRMMYRNGEVKPFGTNEIIKQGELTVKDYEIIQFNYSALSRRKQYKEVIETFFFGPENTTIEEDLAPVNYKVPASDINAQCLINQYEYAYLAKIMANEESFDVDSSMADGETIHGFTKSKDGFSFPITDQEKFDLSCIYQTPDGTITIRQTFFGIKPTTTEAPQTTEKSSGDSEMATKIEDSQDKDSSMMHIIIIAVVVGVVLLCALIYFLLLRKKISIYMRMKEKKKVYPNIFALWEEIRKQTLVEFVKMIYDENYMSSKVKGIKIVKQLESEDTFLESATNLFTDTLIKCFKDIEGLIKANYVKEISSKRQYIISEGPSKSSISNFFKMLYLEDVAVVVSILYKGVKNAVFWPDKATTYGDLKIDPMESTKGLSVSKFTFKLTLESKDPKTVTIFHVQDWREFDLPASTKDLIDLYKNVSGVAGDKTVVVHNSREPGTRVFIFTYFACIFERMIEDKGIENPMDVIKEIREKCFGGCITTKEFALIISALITHFFDNGYLVDSDKEKSKFFKEYGTYMCESPVPDSTVEQNIVSLSKFLSAMDKGKIDEIIKRTRTVQVYASEVINKKCQRFYAILGDK